MAKEKEENLYQIIRKASLFVGLLFSSLDNACTF